MNPTRQLRISAWAIQNPTPVAVLFIALVLAGIISYLTLPVKNFPDIEFPVVIVTVTQSGAAPQELKTQVTRQVENSLTRDHGRTVHVVSGHAGLLGHPRAVQYRHRHAEGDRRRPRPGGGDAGAVAARDRPADGDPFRLRRSTDHHLRRGAQPGVTMSASELSWIVDNDISRTLQGVPGVGQVSRIGGVDREINVIIDPVRMAAQEVTAPQINQALASVSEDAAGGRVQVGGREQTLRVLGAATSVDQIRNLALPGTGGRFVKLSDVADVGDGTAEVRSEAKLDGAPVVAFNITKTREASDVSTEDGVDAALGVKKGIAQASPPGHSDIVIRKIYSAVDDTRGGFAATKETMLEGMVLAAFVVWLFLRDWRATSVTAMAMPVSLIPVFAFMALAGFSLDMVTLLALTLVIGILVDDAIVEIENIEKRVHGGMRPYAAAMEGADQIGLAVVATTSAIVVVFAPVSFMPGIPGQFFREFGLTVVGGRAVLSGGGAAADAAARRLFPEAEAGAPARAAAQDLYEHPALGA